MLVNCTGWSTIGSMHAQKVIELLGYSANEAKVYLAALNLGECHISDIATKTNMPRTTVQVIVDTLHKDGLMNFYVMRRYKYWVAENPERFLIRLTKQQQLVKESLPALTALRKNSLRTRNITEEKKSDWDIIRILADASLQPMLITDDMSRIIYVNIAWEKLFGYSLAEVRGQLPNMLQSGKTPKSVYVKMREALNHKKMFQSDEIVDRRSDGTFFTLLTTILPVQHNDKLFYIQILDDITEQKRVEALRKKIPRNTTGQ